LTTYIVESTALIKAPSSLVYSIVADYRDGHPHILPKPDFLSLHVEQGGYGEGTVINFEMMVLGRKRSFRAAVTEPEPGRVLVETNLEEDGALSSFILTPIDHEQTEVKIRTEGKTQRDGALGRLERWVTGMYLRRVYLRELALLDALAQKRRDAGASSS
jgi:hypothetical protein